jgi:hypothetical protein
MEPAGCGTTGFERWWGRGWSPPSTGGHGSGKSTTWSRPEWLGDSILLHELGHIVTSWLCGKKLHRLHVGPFQWAARKGRWRFELLSKQAGGPIASLFVGLASLLPWRNMDNTPGVSWFAMLATFSLLMFFSNLSPQRTRLLYSDGAQLYQVLSNGPWFKVHLAFGMVASTAMTPTRPRDGDLSLINEFAGIVKNTREALLLKVFAGCYYLDSGDLPQAVASFKAAEALFTDNIPKPADLCAFFAYANALYARDLPAAELWRSKIQALPKIDFDAEYGKARSAVLWLQEDMDASRQAWARGNRLAQAIPSSESHSVAATAQSSATADLLRCSFGMRKSAARDSHGDRASQSSDRLRSLRPAMERIGHPGRVRADLAARDAPIRSLGLG